MKTSQIKYVESDKGRVAIVTLTNNSGAKVVLSAIGAGIVEVWVPNKKGEMADVVLGYTDPLDYFYDGPCAGKVPGRYANRIAKGHFTLDGVEYTLPINNGPNSLHGGPEGFQNQVWTLVEHSDSTAVFEYVSADGEMGYPGKLTATVTYEWTEQNELRVKLEAVTDKPTVVNLTNHAYWNLAGHNAGCIFDHKLQLKAMTYLPTDSNLVPEGVAVDVAGTPMDFTSPKTIGRDIRMPFPALVYGKGYDNCWVIDEYKPGRTQIVAVLSDPAAGRALEVSTDQPGVQVYAGCWLSGSPVNKSGRSYEDYDGVAIECQNFPDAPNVEAFPSAVLRPGEKYKRHINFQFKTI